MNRIRRKEFVREFKVWTREKSNSSGVAPDLIKFSINGLPGEVSIHSETFLMSKPRFSRRRIVLEFPRLFQNDFL